MHQDLFQYSDDPIMQRVWKERIEPNLDQKQYTVNKNELRIFLNLHKLFYQTNKDDTISDLKRL